MLEFVTKLFGDKKERDLKDIEPIVGQINAEYEKLRALTDDELRQMTDTLKQEVADHVWDFEAKIDTLKEDAEMTENVADKEAKYAEIDKIKVDRNKALEDKLFEILPVAFAVVKETARRLTENKELRVTKTSWDEAISEKRQNVIIDGDTAIWKNQWSAAGGDIEWNMIHYDVQLIGGIVLHQGKIAEMATGEGKTLVATLPVYLNALTGKGVHLVTVNNYLAQRDCEWNGPIFEFHKFTVDCIDLYEPNSDDRRNAYLSDITYGTNNEFGFDYLRDNMSTNAEFLVQRDHHYAIIDEIDSVLIDEARTPLIISGPVPQGDRQEFHSMKPRIEKLVNAQRKFVNQILAEAKRDLASEDKKVAQAAATQLFRAYRGLPKHTPLIKFLSEPGMRTQLNKTEGFYLQDKGKNMHIVDDELYFVIDEKNNQVELTDKGRDLITTGGEDPNLFVMPEVGLLLAEIENDSSMSDEEKLARKDELSREFGEKSERLHTINQMVKAYALFEKDVEYIVQDGKVLIVDEQTGRVLPGRRYSDGLHQAIEAKENVQVEAATQTFATVTLQNYFRMYHKLAGMTGTAETEAGEFYEIYKLDVVVIPTNRPIIRKDQEDLVYKTKREKYNAVIEEIEVMVEEGRPILVGTTSVEVSELLSRMLKIRKIPHNVLNAKMHQKEAEIVAEAGLPGTVTIATNMAGRGTDIKLADGVRESGGLAIIGTERHDSRRVDRQLRGRSGRQGDPGSSQFFVSLEDDLMRLFGSERIAKIMDTLGIKEGEVIQHKMITKSITNAQKKVEENNFAMRKRLLEYDDVMNSQREVIYRRRRNALFGDRIKVDLDNMLLDLADLIAARYYHALDHEGLQLECIRLLSVDPKIGEREIGDMSEREVADRIYETASELYNRRTKSLAEGVLPGLQNIRENRPEVKLVQIIFNDGNRKWPIIVEMDKALRTKGMEVPTTLEKTIMLSVIDEKWKDHLREMDELRQAVQNAVFEQKDPLLVYKFESYQLFQRMLEEVNQQVISLIFKSAIETSEQQAQQREQRRDDFSNLKARHDDMNQVRKKETQGLVTNSPEGDDRQLSRRERRMQQRGGKKKKR